MANYLERCNVTAVKKVLKEKYIPVVTGNLTLVGASPGRLTGGGESRKCELSSEVGRRIYQMVVTASAKALRQDMLVDLRNC